MLSVPPPMSMDRPLTLLTQADEVVPPADRWLDVDEIEGVALRSRRDHGIVVARTEVDLVSRQALADLDEIVGRSRQRRERVACGIEKEPVVGKVDRTSGASGSDQDIGVAELQDFDIRERVGSVASRNGVCNGRLAGTGRIECNRVLRPGAGKDRNVTAGAAVDGVVAAAADKRVAVAVSGQRIPEGRTGDADAPRDGVGSD